LNNIGQNNKRGIMKKFIIVLFLLMVMFMQGCAMLKAGLAGYVIYQIIESTN